MSKVSILFVCLGNICRSPTAEGIFRKLVRDAGLEARFEIDSCGTGGWHTGEPPHPETQDVARVRGVDLSGLRARKLCAADFQRFQYIVAMDKKNLRELQAQAGDSQAQIFLLREHDWDRDDLSVPDPYYEGGFAGVFEICQRSCEALFEQLIKGHQLRW